MTVIELYKQIILGGMEYEDYFCLIVITISLRRSWIWTLWYFGIFKLGEARNRFFQLKHHHGHSLRKVLVIECHKWQELRSWDNAGSEIIRRLWCVTGNWKLVWHDGLVHSSKSTGGSPEFHPNLPPESRDLRDTRSIWIFVVSFLDPTTYQL